MLAKASEYAIRALVYIELQNRKGEWPGFKEIAQEMETPEHYTAKILQNLTRFGLIGSKKGRSGGFYFHNDSKPLKLFDVILVMDGDRLSTKCGFGFKSCNSDNPCPLHSEYVDIRERFSQLFRKETIQSLVDKIEYGTAVLTRSN